MSNDKRYGFQGHAVAVEARRRGERTPTMYAAAALPLTGGYGYVKDEDGPRPAGQNDELFDVAEAYVAGDFVDPNNNDALVEDTSGMARTETAAYVKGYNLLARVTVDNMTAHLLLRDRRQGQPDIFFGDKHPITGNPDQLPIVGLKVDGCLVNIEYDPVFGQLTRLEQLEARFPKDSGVSEEQYVIPTTIVSRLSWDDKDCPKRARIDGNSIIIDGLGRIFLGELFIGARFRHLTLLRVQLEPGGRDHHSAGDTQSGPVPWP